MENGHSQVRGGEELATDVLLHKFLGRTGEVGAVVWHVDGEEAHRKDGFALGEGDPPLVQARRSHNLAQSGSETVQSLGGTSDDVHGRSVVKRDADLGVGREVAVDAFDVLLQRTEAQTADRKHGSGDALVVLDRVGDDLGLDRKKGERLLSAKTDVEEELDSLEDAGLERLPAVRGCDGDRGDDSLGVTGSAVEEVPHLTGGEVGDAAADDVLGELGHADEGHGEGDTGEVVDVRTGYRAIEPGHEVQALRVVGVAVGFGLVAEGDEGRGDFREEGCDEGSVGGVEGLDLVEVILGIS